MNEFKFNFLNGYYLVSSPSDDEVIKINLENLVIIQNQLRNILPHREREIDSFILSCVNDVVNGDSLQK